MEYRDHTVLIPIHEERGSHTSINEFFLLKRFELHPKKHYHCYSKKKQSTTHESTEEDVIRNEGQGHI